MNKADRLYIPVFSLTLLLSAALLFSVQPMFSKMILPLLGGSPQVWNTAMLFFQAMLLGGYAYAHGTTRFLSVRKQALLHVTLLIICMVFLPIAITESWKSMQVASYPVLWQFGLMLVTLGGPFFVLSGSAPMLQRWFSVSSHKDSSNPYFLYAASNLGSMAALLSYPFFIEPLLSLPEQSRMWALGYIALIIMTVFSALLMWKSPKKIDETTIVQKDTPLSLNTCLMWVLLAFLPSSLMLGVTTYITTDIASVPLLWILPLALYVLTFICAFAKKPPISFSKINAFHFIFLAFAIVTMINSALNFSRVALVPIHLGLFFFSALLCHTRLAMLRPPASQLTAFYLLMSLGGVLGGIFNALIAPYLFVIPLEYKLIVALACLFRFYPERKNSGQSDKTETIMKVAVFIVACATIATFISSRATITLMSAGFIVFSLAFLMDRKRYFFAAAAFVLIANSGFNWQGYADGTMLSIQRNFFGIKTVRYDPDDDTRVLIHGTTIHGYQSANDAYRLTPLAYYYPESAAGDFFKLIENYPLPQRIGVVGLGTGTLACYVKKGRDYDFYEIDPQVIEIAENPKLFTFLKDCGSPYRIIEGDGRLKISEAPDSSYDMIFLDAFSSDNIPIHILTKEAFEIYLKKLKPNGIIVANLSNRYFDLDPVIEGIARELDLHAFFRKSEGGYVQESKKLKYAPSSFVVLSQNNDTLIPIAGSPNWRRFEGDNAKAWTDTYADVLSTFMIFSNFTTTDSHKSGTGNNKNSVP